MGVSIEVPHEPFVILLFSFELAEMRKKVRVICQIYGKVKVNSPKIRQPFKNAFPNSGLIFSMRLLRKFSTHSAHTHSLMCFNEGL